MKNHSFKVKAALASLMFLGGTANAGIITSGSLIKDTDDNFITDTATNLDWIQWDYGHPMGTLSSLELRLNGGDLDGWEIASTSQLFTLLSNVGLTQYDAIASDPLCNDGQVSTVCTSGPGYYQVYDVSVNSPAAYDSLEAMFTPSGPVSFTDGRTYVFSKDDESYYGRSADDQWSRFRLQQDGFSYVEENAHVTVSINTDSFWASAGVPSSQSVVALVRTTTSVPEPSTLAVFGLGILGLVSRRVKSSLGLMNETGIRT